MEETSPPAPWRLKGDAILRLQRLPAGEFVPPGLRRMQVSPGYTLGGVYAARYGDGSTLRYHELIVFSALAIKGLRLGFSVSHIYVDDPVAAAGGQRIWGLPKRLAAFHWTHGAGERTIAVEDGDVALCRIRMPETNHPARLPVVAPFWSSRDARLLHFLVTGTARVAVTRGELTVPQSSPFAGIGLKSGRMLEFNQLDVKVPGA